MSAAFTSGQWAAMLDDGDWYVTAYVDGHPTIVADIEPMFKSAAIAANAHLIAAAPELFEALELADATLRGANMNRNVVERKIVTALAKARGEQSL